MIGTHVSVTDDLALLLGVMPPHMQSLLEEHAKHDVLLEVVLDLGRLPQARLPPPSHSGSGGIVKKK